MDRISEADVRIEATLYKQQGKVEVYKVFNNKSGQAICMKKIFVEDVMDATDIQGELIAMANLNHPNILSLKSASLGGQNRNITHVLIFMDFFEEGDLEKMIQTKVRSGIFYTESELLSYINQIVDACEYMQGKEAAHRDIKPQNIFVCEQGKKLKLGDLGSAAKKDAHAGSTLIGTPLYLSPKLREVFMANQNMRVVNHNMFKSDVYSLGLTFLYMASLKPIKDLCMIIGLEQKIKSRIEELPNEYSIVKRILKEMLEVDEYNRPDFIELKRMLKDFTQVKVPNQQTCKELKKGEDLKVKVTTVLQLIGFCEECKRECNENEIYYIQGHLVCTICFEKFREFSKE
jgi:serine/threonine protein kinase